MWNQSDWPGKQLLSDRPPLLICAVTLLSCTWSHPWSSIWSEDWHVVSWLYPGRTVLRKCESISTLCFNFVCSVLVSNQCLGICGHMDLSLPDMHYSHLNKIFFILYVWDPSGAIPKWFPCNTAGTGGGDSGAYWPRTISKGERYPQILHQKSHAVWAESGMPLHSVWRSFKNSSFSLKILHLWSYCIKGQLDSMSCLKPISY